MKFQMLVSCLLIRISGFLFLSGEVTADELFSRLQQIKDGPEQQNITPSTENGEEPVGKCAYKCLYFVSVISHFVI